MTLMLTPEVGQRLTEEARRAGVTVEQYALKVLERALPDGQGRAELVESWTAVADAGEAQADADFFRMIDEDRLSDRKLFPPELKGVTW